MTLDEEKTKHVPTYKQLEVKVKPNRTCNVVYKCISMTFDK